MYLSELHVPISGVGLWALPRSQPLRHIPEDDVGALRLVVDEVEFLRLFLHFLDLVGRQIHQTVDLLFEAFVALKLGK